jgi:hypothetical protein
VTKIEIPISSPPSNSAAVALRRRSSIGMTVAMPRGTARAAA